MKCCLHYQTICATHVRSMKNTKNLVIVESPAKAKTIQGYLGKDFEVKSSFGHIRDLPKKGLAIDIENDFAPTYEVSPEKAKTVRELKQAAKGATVWLASDEDREGEAIAWHLVQAMGLDEKDTKRIVFHEITKDAITAAIKSPRHIDVHLVDAQQARRVLDRLVGYELSPVLWRKVRPGLSAGRVQSVAVRLVVERERDISAFEAKAEYKISGTLLTSDNKPVPVLAKSRAKTEQDARQLLDTYRQSTLSVSDIETKDGARRPGPPFTTSTLQQEASQKLGFSVRQTMTLAQRLYEAGHITYMRTDSLNLSDQAITQVSTYIKDHFGTEYLNITRYKTKSKGAQEAHEAIRPTNFTKEKAGNDPQTQKLYRLIYERALASQMSPAKTQKTKITITNKSAKVPLIASGEVVVFDGYLRLRGQYDDTLLPAVKIGDQLDIESLSARQTYAKPPARYTESSLVKKLEQLGIGRPSTYAPTISTIQSRGYVEKGMGEGSTRQIETLTLKNGEIAKSTENESYGSDKNKLIPTPAGVQVTDFLVKHLPKVVDYSFTAQMEDNFDQIARGNTKWQQAISKFYGPFHQLVEKAMLVSRADAAQARLVGNDPKSNEPIYARYGRYGPMLQKGDGSEDEKPVFAPLPPGEKIETIGMDAALKAFDLPRMLDQTEQGEEISTSIGRFGPYVKYGSQYASIKGEDPHTITLERALEVIASHKKQQAERYIRRFEKEGIDILNGRFGPYITDGKKNAKIPKSTDPATITLSAARDLLLAAPARGKYNRGKSGDRRKKSGNTAKKS